MEAYFTEGSEGMGIWKPSSKIYEFMYLRSYQVNINMTLTLMKMMSYLKVSFVLGQLLDLLPQGLHHFILLVFTRELDHLLWRGVLLGG